MEKEKTLIESKCPYCGHENFHEFQDDNSNNTIIGRCSINLGGCGKSFAIRIPFDYMKPRKPDFDYGGFENADQEDKVFSELITCDRRYLSGKSLRWYSAYFIDCGLEN